MPIAWIFTKPQRDGYQEIPDDPRTSTPVDKGLPKLRARTTSTVDRFDCRYLLSTAQVAQLETFFVTTTSQGTATFQWTDPRTAATLNVKFDTRPQYIPIGTYWHATFRLMEVPA